MKSTEIGFFRLKQIIGDPEANPQVPAIIPISRSAFLQGVKDGVYPAPRKISKGVTVWLKSEIIEFISKYSGNSECL